MQPTGSLRDSVGRLRRSGGLVEDGVHQVRLFRAPIWCPSGGGGAREAGSSAAGTLVGRSSALQYRGEYAPDSAKAEGS